MWSNFDIFDEIYVSSMDKYSLIFNFWNYLLETQLHNRYTLYILTLTWNQTFQKLWIVHIFQKSKSNKTPAFSILDSLVSLCTYGKDEMSLWWKDNGYSCFSQSHNLLITCGACRLTQTVSLIPTKLYCVTNYYCKFLKINTRDYKFVWHKNNSQFAFPWSYMCVGVRARARMCVCVYVCIYIYIQSTKGYAPFEESEVFLTSKLIWIQVFCDPMPSCLAAGLPSLWTRNRKKLHRRRSGERCWKWFDGEKQVLGAAPPGFIPNGERTTCGCLEAAPFFVFLFFFIAWKTTERRDRQMFSFVYLFIPSPLDPSQEGTATLPLAEPLISHA